MSSSICDRNGLPCSLLACSWNVCSYVFWKFLHFFRLLQTSIAAVISDLHSRVPTSGPFMVIARSAWSISVDKQLLSLVFTCFSTLHPHSCQAFDTGIKRQTSARFTRAGNTRQYDVWSFISWVRHYFVHVIMWLFTSSGMEGFQLAKSCLNISYSATSWCSRVSSE